MPSERHIDRQVEWRAELQKYGCNARLERTIYIRGARVVVDVYAETEGKIFLIEVGNIEDERKTALMQYYAENNPNIQFIHEDYGENKIPKVLESITIYRNSPEYEMERKLREYRKKNPKPTWNDLHFKFFLGILTFVILVLMMLIVFLPVSESETAPLARSVPAKLVLVFFFLAGWGLVSKYMWSHRNTFEHTRYDEKLAQEVKALGQELKTLEEETVKDVKVLFPDEIAELLTFKDKGDHIKVSPRNFLGAEDFAKICSIIREAQGEYVSQGRDSHFKVPKH